MLAPPPPRDLAPAAPPTFSVVIAAHDAAATIREAIESALGQSLAPIEVIVVDDGSTDETSDVVRRVGPPVVLAQRPHRGVAAARNTALSLARGDFVAVLDADDVYERERIEALAELGASRPDLDILATDALLEADGSVVGRFSERTPFPVEDQRLHIIERCFLAEPAVRRSTIAAVGGFDETLRIGEDWECWIRLLYAGARAGFVDEPLLRYRVGGPSLTANRAAALRSRVEVLERAARLRMTPEERRHLDHFLVRRRGRALLAEVASAVEERGPGARRRAAEAAFGPGLRLGVRAQLLARAATPARRR